MLGLTKATKATSKEDDRATERKCNAHKNYEILKFVVSLLFWNPTGIDCERYWYLARMSKERYSIEKQKTLWQRLNKSNNTSNKSQIVLCVTLCSLFYATRKKITQKILITTEHLHLCCATYTIFVVSLHLNIVFTVEEFEKCFIWLRIFDFPVR